MRKAGTGRFWLQSCHGRLRSLRYTWVWRYGCGRPWRGHGAAHRPYHASTVSENATSGLRAPVILPFISSQLSIENFLWWTALGLVAGGVSGSLFEWALHRYLMHRPWWGFGYPFERHTLVHHRIFRADSSYHLHSNEDKHTVPMAWWNGPALIVVSQVPFLVISWLTGHWGLVCGTLLAACAYYGAYEYMHWCMHIPRKRHVERSGIFFRLNGHHLLHHRYMNKNFNVVLPLADLLFGTLLLRAPVRFAQARGPGLPDVQPR